MSFQLVRRAFFPAHPLIHKQRMSPRGDCPAGARLVNVHQPVIHTQGKNSHKRPPSTDNP